MVRFTRLDSQAGSQELFSFCSTGGLFPPFPRPGGWGEGQGLAQCPPWEAAQACDGEAGARSVHLGLERETEAAPCPGEDLESAVGVTAPRVTLGEGASLCWASFLNEARSRLRLPCAQAGEEAAAVLTKGKRLVGVKVVKTAPVQRVTLGKSLSEPQFAPL